MMPFDCAECKVSFDIKPTYTTLCPYCRKGLNRVEVSTFEDARNRREIREDRIDDNICAHCKKYIKKSSGRATYTKRQPLAWDNKLDEPKRNCKWTFSCCLPCFNQMSPFERENYFTGVSQITVME
jgi:hypothetical protein